MITPQAYDFTTSIAYDEKNNVTSIGFERTTGPRDPIPPTTVSAYDDKPIPYSDTKNWVFLTKAWCTDRMIYTLSQNNLMKIIIDVGSVNPTTTEISYIYNAQGYPTEENSNWKREIGNDKGSDTITFLYTCR